MSKIYGYARCSTAEDRQDINRQVRELKAAGAEEVVFEYEHGDAKVEKELHMLLEMAESDDTIVTLEVSRLSRSTQQLCEIIDVIFAMNQTFGMLIFCDSSSNSYCCFLCRSSHSSARVSFALHLPVSIRMWNHMLIFTHRFASFHVKICM